MEEATAVADVAAVVKVAAVDLLTFLKALQLPVCSDSTLEAA